ncbi:unnamed protein product [Caenorhabditis brenneri]
MKEVSAKKLSTKKPKLKNSAEKVEKRDDQFELVEFVVKHFRIPSWQEFSGQKYFHSDVNQLISDVIEMFKEEKALAHISPPVTIVGDLNGQFQDLIRIFNIKNEKSKKDGEEDHKQVFATEKFVFLGDYTDSSQFNLETVCLLFGLKLLYSQRYILLRGHQETLLNSEFHNQVLKRFPGDYGEEIWKKFKIAFSLLPVAACVGEKILCVHSGITADVKKSVDEFRKIARTENIEDISAISRDLILSCPMDDDKDGAESQEPVFCTYFDKVKRPKVFNEAAVKQFCEKTKIELIVRSHEVPPSGFRFFADKKLITVFSAPAYHTYKNNGAFLRVDQEGVVSIVQLRPTERKAEEKAPKKKSGESGKKSVEKEIDSKETGKKGSKDKTNDSKEEGKETGKKKKSNSKPSKEIESLYDNLSEKGAPA